MPAESLTDDEKRRHAIAVDRVRAKLFSVHARERWGVLAEGVIDASATERSEPTDEGRRTVREIKLGGVWLELEPGAKGYRLRLNVKHWERDTFLASIETEDPAKRPFTGYTEWVKFAKLPTRLFEVLQALRQQ